MPLAPLTLQDAVAFAGRFTKAPGCWLWTASRGGYGTFKGRPAHRVAWIIEHGAIPPGMMVCHRCDMPACVNPAHLFLGTAKDNAQDMAAKGRARDQAQTPNTRRAFRINTMKLAGMTWAEIAKVEGITPDYARTLVQNAQRLVPNTKMSEQRRQAIRRAAATKQP